MNERFNGPYKRHDGDFNALELGEVFAVAYQGRLHFVSYKCPCNCGHTLSIPVQGSLMADSWNASFDEAGLMTITPSVVMLEDCLSHYFITGGMVQWC